jgi:glycosyltransferase involved in cell wall biosynthesis
MTEVATSPIWKSFRLVHSRGRVYAVPRFLDHEVLEKGGKLHAHPAVLSASTRADLETLLDNFDLRFYQPDFLGASSGYNLYRYRGAIYGVPVPFDRATRDPEERMRRPGVLRGATVEEVQERIRTTLDRVPVEFAGWLPVYEYSGNCGKHPQFQHIADPPPGYRFTCSAPAEPKQKSSRWEKVIGWCRDRLGLAFRTAGVLIRPFFAVFRPGPAGTWRGRGRVLAAMIRLFLTLLWNGARLPYILRFLQSRHYQSQVLVGDCPGLVFLTSMPYTFGQSPWVIEIEDPTTLFYPLIENGLTKKMGLADSPYFPIVKTLLESESCRGILTHMKSTARLVPALFKSEKITNKVRYTPLGIKLPERWQRHEESDHDPIDLLFINSWCQVSANFYVRGGLDVLEAFAILHKRYPRLRLTLRTDLPGLDAHYHRIMETGWVRIINRFLQPDEMESLLAGSHIFLLPAARVHILSLLQAMSHGLAVVTSDGWGIEEYVTNDRNGIIVKGRYGKTSWVDEEQHMLREDYEPTYRSDPVVVRGIVEAVSRLIEDRALRQRLGRTAREDVRTTYNLERWNRALAQVFDSALAPASAG